MGKVKNPRPSHPAAKAERIDRAREHYATRAERRPDQVWLRDDAIHTAAPKGERGALPDKVRRDF